MITVSSCDNATVMWLFGHIKLQVAMLAFRQKLDLRAPRGFLERLSRDVAMRCDQVECGLEGCVLNVILKRDHSTVPLGKIPLSMSRLPVCELRLYIEEEEKTWHHWNDIFNLFKSNVVYLSSYTKMEKVPLPPTNSEPSSERA